MPIMNPSKDEPIQEDKAQAQDSNSAADKSQGEAAGGDAGTNNDGDSAGAGKRYGFMQQNAPSILQRHRKREGQGQEQGQGGSAEKGAAAGRGGSSAGSGGK